MHNPNTDNITSKPQNVWLPLYEITEICKRMGIKRENIKERKQDFHQIITEYFKANPEFGQNKSMILNELKNFIK